MRSPGGASDASPAPRDASEPRDADAHVERSPALDADGHATESPPRKGKRRGKRGGVRAGAAPASAADVAETRDADAAPLARAGADDDRATESETRESETSAATAKNPVSPVAPQEALSVAAGVDKSEAGRSPATPSLALARRDRARAVSPPTAPDATADAPTSGEGYETSEAVQKTFFKSRGSVEEASVLDADVDVADERLETKKQTASAPAWIEPPAAPSFDAGGLPVENQSLKSDPRTNAADAPRARVDDDDDDATRKKKTAAETSPSPSDAAIDVERDETENAAPPSYRGTVSNGVERNDDGNAAIREKKETFNSFPFPSAKEGVTPNNVVSVSAYDGKRAQRLVFVPEHKVGLVLGRGGAHAAYFQHHSGASIHVARDPGEVPGAGITIFEVPPESDESDEDEDEDASRRESISSVSFGETPSSKKRRAPKPAVDAAHRRRIHLLGSDTATAAAAAMIARLVETSSHRLDRASADTTRRRRETSFRDRFDDRSLPLPDISEGSLALDAGYHRLGENRHRLGSRPASLYPPIGFADDVPKDGVVSEDATAEKEKNAIVARKESPRTVATMRVPHRRVGLIIGRRGDNVRFLQDLTRAHIQVQPERELRPGQTHRLLTIRGAESAVAEAVRAVEDMCAGKTRVGSAQVIPPQPFAVDSLPGTLGTGTETETFVADEPLSGGTYDVTRHESPYGSYGDARASYGSLGPHYSHYSYEPWRYVPALPWRADDAPADANAYTYYAYANAHAPYAYAPTPYAYDPSHYYASHYVDPRFAHGFAYVPGYVPGTSPGMSPDVPDASAAIETPPATGSGRVPGTLPREEFPTPGEWHVPAVSVLQPDVEYPGDADAASVPVPGTAFGDGDDLVSRRRRHEMSGERRRGGKSRRGGKGRPSSSSSSERASTRFARDVSSSRADDSSVQSTTLAENLSSPDVRTRRALETSPDETRDTKRPVSMSVSFPASPEPGVGTGVFLVEPP